MADYGKANSGSIKSLFRYCLNPRESPNQDTHLQRADQSAFLPVSEVFAHLFHGPGGAVETVGPQRVPDVSHRKDRATRGICSPFKPSG